MREFLRNLMIIHLVNLLTAPMMKFKAYSFGIIDTKGKLTRLKKHMKEDERQTVSEYDLQVWKLRFKMEKSVIDETELERIFKLYIKIKEYHTRLTFQKDADKVLDKFIFSSNPRVYDYILINFREYVKYSLSEMQTTSHMDIPSTSFLTGKEIKKKIISVSPTVFKRERENGWQKYRELLKTHQIVYVKNNESGETVRIV